MNTFFTYYARKNHADIDTNLREMDTLYHGMRDRFWAAFWSIKKDEKVVRSYLLEADYEYNPDLIEVK